MANELQEAETNIQIEKSKMEKVFAKLSKFKLLMKQSEKESESKFRNLQV